jgi:hypothetical protein
LLQKHRGGLKVSLLCKYLLCKYEALSSNLSSTNKQTNKQTIEEKDTSFEVGMKPERARVDAYWCQKMYI